MMTKVKQRVSDSTLIYVCNMMSLVYRLEIIKVFSSLDGYMLSGQ